MNLSDPPAPIRFTAQVLYWRGPSPFFFAPVPIRYAARIRQAARTASYGWGAVPVEASVGGIVFETSLFPKDGSYLLPLKAEVRRLANIDAGDLIAIELAVRSARERPSSPLDSE